MINHKLKTYGEIFAESQSVTSNAALGNKNAKVEIGDHLAGLAVTFLASGDVTVAAGGALIATVEHSDTLNGAFTQLGAYSSAGMGDFAAGFKAVDGQALATFPLPETRRFVQVKISGTGITGTVDCILELIPR